MGKKLQKGIAGFFVFFCAACTGKDGEVLLSYLGNNRMTIVLKGSYASDNPLEWDEINNNKLFVDSDISEALSYQTEDSCDPNTVSTCLPDYNKIPLYIDFGGIRLSPKTSSLAGVSNQQDSEDFWDIASDEREVYCSEYYGDQSDGDSCFQNNGIDKFKELMNGKGVIYPSHDVSDQHYVHVGVFVRRFVTGWAYRDGTFVQDAFFDNTIVRGINIIPYVNIPPKASPEEASVPPEWFPLHYRVGGGREPLLKGADYLPVVLEIRFNIKENLMVHNVTTATSDGTNTKTTLAAFSDWRKDHKNEETASSKSFHLGGNVLTRARLYYPHFVSRIEITNTKNGAPLYYYALYLKSETDRENNLPYASTPARFGASQLNHIMPGTYELECRYDGNGDGYPETMDTAAGTMEIEVTQEAGIITRDFSCGS